MKTEKFNLILKEMFVSRTISIEYGGPRCWRWGQEFVCETYVFGNNFFQSSLICLLYQKII